VNSKFKTNGKLNIQQRNDEIGILISNFQILAQNLNIHINNLETIVEERTLQLKKQNNDIISSINYAKNIQEALLPDKKQFEICFPESFIYFKPKSIVSGDFYWFKQFEDKNISVIAVADCTGHGVPGAMMSMLGIAFLNEIVVRESVKTAHEILTELRSQVVGHLNNKQNSIISDGMDISILVFFHNKNIVQFAGAKRDLLLFRNNELSIFQGDKHSIGKSCSEQKSFTNHEIKVKNGDILYLLTDGFQDQLGARSKRTLQKRKAYEFFKEINLYNFNHQLNLIDNYLAYWQKDEPQTDDILIIGLKYSDELFKNNSNKILFEHIN
jgi:serine phosphatase RsbU (regulator of sigma subunit)